MLAGGNGTGKSTFYRTRLKSKGIPFINADILAKLIYPQAAELHSYDAAFIAAQMRKQLLQQGRVFCFETIFSHPSKIDFIAQAKALGYEIILVFIHLDNINLNQARVAQRVKEGGHNVPTEKIISRIPRTQKLIRQAILLCDFVYILDNSRADNPFRKIATINRSVLKLHAEQLSDWANDLLTDYKN